MLELIGLILALALLGIIVRIGKWLMEIGVYALIFVLLILFFIISNS
ncbi:hypothetical protein [Desulfonema magnum]|uniref:Uncharacterized protein n=1 Tax=Desulfonema magnum TaxID=45655 RepID=A0A975BS68_9BACT|nr:hypothetical protein [Desulfonema magnum]QTA90423.1 Uncharacterized protein dnm_064840 [Desulfonema magnum]